MRLGVQGLRQLGGLEEMGRRNQAKAGLLYDAIDESGGFYRGTVRKWCRARMTVTFRLPAEALEEKFVKEAASQKLSGLKGHRTVGGIRASLFHAFPLEGVQALVAFM